MSSCTQNTKDLEWNPEILNAFIYLLYFFPLQNNGKAGYNVGDALDRAIRAGTLPESQQLPMVSCHRLFCELTRKKKLYSTLF